MSDPTLPVDETRGAAAPPWATAPLGPPIAGQYGGATQPPWPNDPNGGQRQASAPDPTLLVDGCVAGVGRAVEGGIEATAFRPLPDEAWDGLAGEARALVAFLAARDPAVYRRCGHWWAKLPPGETRLLR